VPDVEPWAVIAAFVVGLGAALLDVIRRIVTGRLTPRITHQDVIDQRDRWQGAFDKTSATLADQTAQIGRLVSTMEQLATRQAETLTVLRQAMPPQRDAA
jgi:hypothetical protein